MSTEVCDVIIIGSGIGGLTCGTALAKAGLNVIICEQHHRAGGCCSYFSRRGFLFDAGAHLFGSVGNNRTPLGRFLQDIQFDGEFIQVEPMDIVHVAGDTVRIPANVYDYIAFLKSEFPSERGIEAFFYEVRRIYRSFMKEEMLEAYRKATYAELLDNYVQDRRLKAILASQWGYMGLPPRRVSAVAMCAMLSTYFFDGAYYPRGGSKGFVEALVGRFTAFGGKLRLSTRVREIRINREGTVAGVTLEGGEEIRADVVVSNADITQTVTELIDETRLTDLRDRIRSMERSVSAFITYLGAEIAPELLQDKRGWYFESFDMDDPKNEPIYVSIPTLLEPEDARPTKHTIQVTLIPADPDMPWADLKGVYENKVLDWAGRKIPGLKERILVKESATPATIRRYTLNSKGAMYGWAMGPEQMGRLRPQNRTPVPGLFLAGHWSWPAGGVASVMFSGLKAARMAGEYSREIR